MKWFFIEGHHKEHIDELRKQSIVFSAAKMRHPVDAEGIIFPEDHLEAVLGVTGKDPSFAASKQFFTDLKGVFFLDVHSRMNGGSVHVDADNCYCDRNEDDYDDIEEVLQPYADALCVDIYLHHCAERPSLPITDEYIHIFPFSGPVREVGYGQIKKLFGQNLFGTNGLRSLRMRRRNKEMLLRDPSGVIFGERHANNLYIYVDMFSVFAEEHKILVGHILDTYFFISGYEKEIRSLQQSRALSVKNEAEAVQSDAKKKYGRACMQRYYKEIEELKSSISNTEKEITYHSTQITTLQREYENAKEQERRIAGRIHTSDIEEFEQEYQYLMKHPAVKEIHTYDDRIEIFTKTLVLQGYEIGTFRVSLQFKGDFTCENLSYKPNGYSHPHVSGNDNTCFGNAVDDVWDYIKGFHFAVAFHKIWERLNKYSSSDAYTPIENWPLASKKITKKQSKRRKV